MDLTGVFPSSSVSTPVAVDAMGGDYGTTVIVEGAVRAVKEYGVQSILVGSQDEIEAMLQGLGAGELRIAVVHASESISMDESPTRAVRRKPNSSLCIAYDLVHSGRASSVVSAGNSGAMMAAGRIICGLLPGIERPAIATIMPVAGDGPPNVIVDSGANVDCHARNLVQFAIMGSVYCTYLLKIDRPKVALLANGAEASKGTDIIRAAAILLSQLDSIHYIGYVEGRDIGTNVANVIVCDGFVGNVVLKAMEGCVRLVYNELKLELGKGFFGKIAMTLSRGAFRQVFSQKFDYTAYGGAPLLGLRKLALVLHGASDVRAVKNAIRIADSFAREGMNEKITHELTQLEEQTLDIDLEGGAFAGIFSTKKELEEASLKTDLRDIPELGGQGASKEDESR